MSFRNVVRPFATALPFFTTNFPSIENPVSVGGGFVNNGATANGFTFMRVAAAGKCYGTNTGSTFDDSYARMHGFESYTNQVVQVTAGLAPGLPNDGNSREIELYLNIIEDDAGGLKGYEAADIGYLAGPINLVRLDGASGSFTVAAGSFTAFSTPADGDAWKIGRVGNVVTLTQNGNSCGSINVATDANIGGTVYTGGNPGIGAFIRPGALNSDFWFKSATFSTQ